MNVGSLFSGIGGLDLGLHRAGWNHVFLCESDEWRRGVLAVRFPGVPIYDDVHAVEPPSDTQPSGRVHPRLHAEHKIRRRAQRSKPSAFVDLICGGFPCQDLSVAGRRAGLDGARSGLFFEFARVADTLRPRLLLVENVPGLLSSNGGQDFGIVLGTLADIGYGVGWRVLDSRFFGVPQRRRRVFIVGVLAGGDSARAAERAGEILAVGTGCDRHSAKGGEARTDAPVASLSGLGTGGPDDNDGQQGRLVASTLGTRVRYAHSNAETLIAHSLTSQGRGVSEDGTGRGIPIVAAPLSHGSNPNSNMAGRRREDDENLIAFYPTGGSKEGFWQHNISPPMKVGSGTGAPAGIGITQASDVRRLTPIECERLQALPDNWTRVPDTAPDSRRYAALGDAVTASVAEWIGRRLLNAATSTRETEQ